MLNCVEVDKTCEFRYIATNEQGENAPDVAHLSITIRTSKGSMRFITKNLADVRLLREVLDNFIYSSKV